MENQLRYLTHEYPPNPRQGIVSPAGALLRHFSPIDKPTPGMIQFYYWLRSSQRLTAATTLVKCQAFYQALHKEKTMQSKSPTSSRDNVSCNNVMCNYPPPDFFA
jgi:hypothetical protein